MSTELPCGQKDRSFPMRQRVVVFSLLVYTTSIHCYIFFSRGFYSSVYTSLGISLLFSFNFERMVPSKNPLFKLSLILWSRASSIHSVPPSVTASDELYRTFAVYIVRQQFFSISPHLSHFSFKAAACLLAFHNYRTVYRHVPCKFSCVYVCVYVCGCTRVCLCVG